MQEELVEDVINLILYYDLNTILDYCYTSKSTLKKCQSITFWETYFTFHQLPLPLTYPNTISGWKKSAEIMTTVKDIVNNLKKIKYKTVFMYNNNLMDKDKELYYNPSIPKWNLVIDGIFSNYIYITINKALYNFYIITTFSGKKIHINEIDLIDYMYNLMYYLDVNYTYTWTKNFIKNLDELEK